MVNEEYYSIELNCNVDYTNVCGSKAPIEYEIENLLTTKEHCYFLYSRY